ncbi:acylphosphatase [Clostridium sp. MSJ-4]|uniref:Acylphosphatase n=1 Tax=Clostridium simiarum TaxID=2841506 RepID=A0ABS6F3W4_9CLOT|nr:MULTISPECIES: acylphosphatase [Clostridium]MBU5592550.1 acylphosphatase [Clostridium simiarum]
MVRKLLVISGNVQDGGIRYFAQMNASSLKLTGCTRRGSGGTVEIELQGEEANINKLIEKLKAGNGFFTVDNIEVKDIEVNPSEKLFSIK